MSSRNVRLSNLCTEFEQQVAVDLDRPQRLPSAECQQATGEFRAALAGAADVFGKQLEVFPRLELVRQKLRIADDDGQQIVEVVGDAAGELAHGLHLLGLDQLLFGALAVGEVMNDADEDGFAVLLGLADRQVHRKGRAVLAPALNFPADADDLAFAGPVEIVDVAVMLFAVVPRHQHLDVVADDLAGGVFEQPLAGRVEHHHVAAGIDQDDAVDRGIDHGAQPGGALAQGTVGAMAFRQVMDNADEDRTVRLFGLAD